MLVLLKNQIAKYSQHTLETFWCYRYRQALIPVRRLKLDRHERRDLTD